mmetsp:Transcript_10295/g.23519  ORF Transcript_10295/g.23519 Transcript_10295/m.23519 type:complete len:94 (-) Transcript_10295:8-289(-)
MGACPVRNRDSDRHKNHDRRQPGHDMLLQHLVSLAVPPLSVFQGLETRDPPSSLILLLSDHNGFSFPPPPLSSSFASASVCSSCAASFAASAS